MTQDGSFITDGFSLISLTLGTGRMHQIRIHLAQANLPILADDKHGNFKLNKYVNKTYGIKRLQLASISLTLPINGDIKTFTIPYPEHIEQGVSKLALL